MEACFLPFRTNSLPRLLKRHAMQQPRLCREEINVATNKLGKHFSHRESENECTVFFLQKIDLTLKNERQINSNLPSKISHFWRKFNFWAPKTPLLDARGAQTRYDVIWNLCQSFFLAHCASFMSRWPLLRGAGGVCRSVVGKQLSDSIINIFNFRYYIISNMYLYSFSRSIVAWLYLDT